MKDVFCPSRFFFSLAIKKEKKEERRAEKIFAMKKERKIKSFTKGSFCAYERIDEFKLSSFF